MNDTPDVPTIPCRSCGVLTEWRTGVPDNPDFVLACVREDTRRFVIRASYARRFELAASNDWYYEGEDGTNCPEYNEDEDEYYCPEGWYESNEYEEINWYVHGEVIAWMPLPELPPLTEVEDSK